MQHSAIILFKKTTRRNNISLIAKILSMAIVMLPTEVISKEKTTGICNIMIKIERNITAHKQNCSEGDSINIGTDSISIELKIGKIDANIFLKTEHLIYFNDRKNAEFLLGSYGHEAPIYDASSPNYKNGAANTPVGTIFFQYDDE